MIETETFCLAMAFFPRSEEEFAALGVVIVIAILAMCAAVSNWKRMNRIAKAATPEPKVKK